MTEHRIAVLTAGLLLLGTAAGAVSEDHTSDDSSVAISPLVSYGKPSNLKVLPQEITTSALGKVMKRFETDLGVKCGHCHVEDPTTHKFNFASDENPAKSTARQMISMLKDINEKYLTQLGGDRRYSVQVTCGSCHQGQSSPPSFD
jgi:hypothetical protein